MRKATFAVGSLLLAVFAVVTLLTRIPGVQAATPCVITLFGVQYDVSPLQPTGAHPGGNIFVCGTDMTAVYQSMHGTDVTRMIPYLLPTATATPTPTAVPSVSPSPSPTETPVPTVTITPTVTVTPIPSVTVTPSVSPTPGTHDEHEDEAHEEHHEVHENHEREQENHSRGDEHRSVQAALRSRNDHNEESH